jgi:hypothetical protein
VDLEIHYDQEDSEEDEIKDLQNMELDGRPIIQQLSKEIEQFLKIKIVQGQTEEGFVY